MSKALRYAIENVIIDKYSFLSYSVYYNYLFGTYFLLRDKLWLRWDWEAGKFVSFSFDMKPMGFMAESDIEELIFVVKQKQANLSHPLIAR